MRRMLDRQQFRRRACRRGERFALGERHHRVRLAVHDEERARRNHRPEGSDIRLQDARRRRQRHPSQKGGIFARHREEVRIILGTEGEHIGNARPSSICPFGRSAPRLWRQLSRKVRHAFSPREDVHKMAQPSFAVGHRRQRHGDLYPPVERRRRRDHAAAHAHADRGDAIGDGPRLRLQPGNRRVEVLDPVPHRAHATALAALAASAHVRPQRGYSRFGKLFGELAEAGQLVAERPEAMRKHGDRPPSPAFSAAKRRIYALAAAAK